MRLQVRETETWMPPKVRDSPDDLDSSGDFIFPNEDRTKFDDEDKDSYDDTEDFDDMSGSGDYQIDESVTEEEYVTATEVCQYATYKCIK